MRPFSRRFIHRVASLFIMLGMLSSSLAQPATRLYAEPQPATLGQTVPQVTPTTVPPSATATAPSTLTDVPPTATATETATVTATPSPTSTDVPPTAVPPTATPTAMATATQAVPEPQPDPHAQQVTAAGGTLQLDRDWLTLAVPANAFRSDVAVSTTILDPAVASQLSPVDVAFQLTFAPATGGVAAGDIISPTVPLQLTLDYSTLPRRYGGDFESRLRLYRAQHVPCAADPSSQCLTFDPLPSRNDRLNQQLIVDLAQVDVWAQPQAEAVAPSTELALEEVAADPLPVAAQQADLPVDGLDYDILLPYAAAPGKPGQVQAQQRPEAEHPLYLPLISGGVAPSQQGETPDASEPNAQEPETAELPEGPIYVLAASASGPEGTYEASPLANVSEYQVGLYTGAFQTSYPIPVPPAAGGLAPNIVLSYNSGNVDGMTTTKNNQPGWAGIGWSIESSYITRHLKNCTAGIAVGDLCLAGGDHSATDEFSIVLNGVASRLVPESGNLYRLQNDPNWKVEKFTDGASGHPDSQNEYWIVTTPDGTKYRFGGEFMPSSEGGADQNSVYYTNIYNTNSAVCGNYSYNLCDKAWRWNLDRVEDANGNVISYFYELETNYYKALNDSRPEFRKQYVRAGYLKRIEYGRRAGVNAMPPTRVLFTAEERCEGACSWPDDYPDTPGDLTCDATSTCSENSPTFWSRKRLNYIDTQYYDSSTSTWVNVARYDLSYSFPTPPTEPDGDTSEQKLWLESITQQVGGGGSGLPAVQYDYVMLANRTYHSSSTVPAMYMPRIDKVTSELGGVTNLTYGQSHPCQSGGSNIRLPYDCFPAWYVNGSSAGWTYWNKWKITQMSQSDSFSGNDVQTTTYDYSVPTWHYSNDPTLPEINDCDDCPANHWNDFRGHEIVTVTDGTGHVTEYRFYRGMDQDRNSTSGGTYSASITLSDSTTRTDHNWLAGQVVETRQLSSGTTPRTRTVNWFDADLNAGSGIYGARFVKLTKSENTLYASTNKTTRTEYQYDAYGNVTHEILHGDLATTGDDRLVQRTFLHNTGGSTYLVDRPRWEKLWSGTSVGSSGQEKAYTEFFYDGASSSGTLPTTGNLTKVRTYWQATPSYQFYDTTTTYDSYGRPTTVTDPRGNSTTTAYDSTYGYVQSVTNELNHTTTFQVDPAWGVQTQITDANGHSTNLAYDDYGRLEKVWLPTESTGGPPTLQFTYEFGSTSEPSRVKSQQALTSGVYLDSWTYVDGFGREIQSQRASPNSGQRVLTSQHYDDRGLLHRSSAPYEASGLSGSGYVTPTWTALSNYHQFTYDELGRQTQNETRSLNSPLWDVETTYDGWTQSHYDANDHRTDQHFDAFGQLVRVTEYDTGAQYDTAYAYDLQGNLTSVTDELSHVTTMQYDLLGRKTGMTDPDMGTWSYEYDGAGNLIAQQDGRGWWMHLAYDDLNRLITKRKDSVSGTKIAEYIFDAASQKGLLSKSIAYDSSGTVSAEVHYVTYDARNRLTRQQWTVTGSGQFRMDYAYNQADLQTSATYPGGNGLEQGEVVSYSYDSLGQMTGVSGGGVSYVSSASYNVQGQLTDLRNDTGSNGLTRSYGYNANTLRLSTLQAGAVTAGSNRQNLSYTYDDAGNITSLTDGINSNQVQSFGYDPLDRLTSASTNAAGTGQYNHTYTYNAIDNITNYDGASYTYGSSRPHALTAAHGNSYSYDGNGNQTGRTVGGTTYTLTFDYENRLTAISGGSTDASFVYDADGNRVRGTVNGEITVYIGGIYEYSPVADTLTLSNQTLTGTDTYEVEDTLTAGPSLTIASGADITFRSGDTISLQPGFHAVSGSTFHAEIAGGASPRVTTYYKGPNGITALRRVGHPDNDGIFYLLRDHLNSSSAITDRGGTTVASHYYYPFGGNRGDAFSALTTKRFTGQYHEEALPGGEGLSYYGARWYDAQVGRFLSADTIVPEPGNPQALNRYAYVFNNPLKYTDPTGHCGSMGAGGIACGGGGGGGGAIVVWSAAKASQQLYRWGLAAATSERVTSIARQVQTYGSTVVDAAEYILNSQRYVSERKSGIPRELQDAIVQTIQDLGDPGMRMAFRGREPGSYIWDGTIEAKPLGAKTLASGPCGLRYCRVPAGENGEIGYGLYVSDLDGAWVVAGNGRRISDPELDDIIDDINTEYGIRVMRHGFHINLVLDWGNSMSQFNLSPSQYDTYFRYVTDPDDIVYVFDSNGYVGSGTMADTYVDARKGR